MSTVHLLNSAAVFCGCEHEGPTRFFQSTVKKLHSESENNKFMISQQRNCLIGLLSINAKGALVPPSPHM